MTALIRGMDYIVDVASVLKKFGFDEIIHWSNSSNSMAGELHRENSEIIVFCPDNIDEEDMKNMQHNIKQLGLPAVRWRSIRH